ncbi:hypothetical protein [Streptomyces sp. NPDC014764]|uniref:hypothetical protein n=1 Tax=Streptomyces sp. NPDC014764 TaxID=3364907 RepID=UPI0036FC3C0C
MRVHEGSDYASVGNDRAWVEVCDMETTGNGVYGKFQLHGSATWHYVGDGNGSQGGCGNRTITNRAIVFYVLRTLGDDTCRGKVLRMASPPGASARAGQPSQRDTRQRAAERG